MSSERSLTQVLPKAIGMLAACFVVILGGIIGFRPGTILVRAFIVGFAVAMIVWLTLQAVRLAGITAPKDNS